jgi:hypothetical protein
LCGYILEGRWQKAMANPGTCPVCVEPIDGKQATGLWTSEGEIIAVHHGTCRARAKRGVYSLEPVPQQRWEKYRP